jgi:cytochrome c oxidase subunit 2
MPMSDHLLRRSLIRLPRPAAFTPGWRVSTARLTVLMVAGTTACGADGPQSALAPDGPAARAVFDLWWLLLALAIFVVVLVIALLIHASLRRREFDGAPATLPLAPDVEKKIRAGELDPAMPASEQIGAGMVGVPRDVALDTSQQDERSLRWILGGGLVFPIVVLTPIFLFTLWTLGLLAGRGATPDLVIEVTGRQYWWEVHYLDAQRQRLFEVANEIHIPVGRRVQVRLRSADVIHSFWVPRLAPKVDNVPGRTTVLWLQADRRGAYRGQCAEYCGTQHAHMAFHVIAESDDRFAAWLAAQQLPAAEPTDPLAVAGREVFLRAPCAQCHTIRGTAAEGDLGPDLTHVASRRTLAAGLLPNTTGHLGGWIADPQALKPGNLMPSVPLESREFEALLHYMSSLR